MRTLIGPTKLAIAGAFLAMASCAHQAKIQPAPPRPVESAAVAPSVEIVKKQAAVQRATSEKLEGKVATLAKATGELQTGLVAATAEAARLRAAKAATESELDGLWQMLTNETSRAAEMFAAAEESRKLADDQKAQRIEAEKRLADLATVAALRDSEVGNLRLQLDAMAKQIQAAQASEAAMQASLAKAEKKAAVGTYLKGIVWVLGIAAFLALALWIASKWRPLPI